MTAKLKRRLSTRTDGQAKAVALLRQLQKLNWHRDAPAKSVRAMRTASIEAATLPREQNERYYRVISDWLVTELLGFGEDIEEYEAKLRARARRASAA